MTYIEFRSGRSSVFGGVMKKNRGQFWLNRKVAVFSILLLCGLQAFGAAAARIKRPKAGETVEVLVQYATQPTEEHHRRVTNFNGRVRATFENIPVAHYDVTPEALADLEANPDVVSINPNLPVGAFVDQATYSADYWPVSSYYVSIGRSKAYGIGIAIIDSGIDMSHPDLAHFATANSRVVYNQSFVPTDRYTGDDYGHGTHVAG